MKSGRRIKNKEGHQPLPFVISRSTAKKNLTPAPFRAKFQKYRNPNEEEQKGMENLEFEVSFVQDYMKEEWVCFHILNGDFRDYVFFLGELDNPEQFAYSHAQLNENGGEIEVLPPTEASSRLAISLNDFFIANREKLVDNFKQSLYNGNFA